MRERVIAYLVTQEGFEEDELKQRDDEELIEMFAFSWQSDGYSKAILEEQSKNVSGNH